jgi:folate-dependent phosphoribosylglycinamide formyltransferase PurN
MSISNLPSKPKWCALFSQTGSEICDLSDRLGFKPDLIITDNLYNSPEIDSRIHSMPVVDKVFIKVYNPKEKVELYRKVFKGFDVITLHGWLNIIPPQTCEEFTIYNGHPGLITHYPELKGKDPQVRTFENIGRFMYVGSVVHRVTPEVDGGAVVVASKTYNTHCSTLDETYNTLKKTSLDSWLDFFNHKCYNQS